MMEWWNGLNTLQHVYFWMAVPAFVLMILQTILSVIGADHDMDTDIDVDVDLDCLSFFTIRGLVAFFIVGGTVGFFVAEDKNLWGLAIVLSIITGLLALIGMGFLVRLIMKLQNEGVVDAKNSIGKKGTVYIRVPKQGEGTGKVNVLVQESYVEFDAVSNGEELPTGCNIKVVDVRNQTLIVEKDE